MQALKQAYSVLVDAKKRATYDACGLNAAGLHVDPDLFHRRPKDGGDVMARAHLSFETAAFGGVHSLCMQRKAACEECKVRFQGHASSQKARLIKHGQMPILRAGWVRYLRPATQCRINMAIPAGFRWPFGRDAYKVPDVSGQTLGDKAPEAWAQPLQPQAAVSDVLRAGVARRAAVQGLPGDR